MQLNKLNKQVKPSLLELALSSNISEDMQRYIIRTCSSPFDIELFYSSIKNISPSILLNLTARADRKGWSEEARKFYSISKDSISSLEPSNRKQRLLSKLKITYEKLNRIEMAQISKPESFDYDIPQKGVHTLGLFNTYGGSWNHPHIKAVFKASKLCAAFDLDLALINFPKISYDELISEVKKEMRITSNNFLEELYSLERVTFFDKDIDELIVGKKVVTTAKPDLNKIILPDEKLCMIMGLGPKGLPKSYIKKASHHFELTGTNVSFETGTAMGAICSELSFRRI